MEEIRKITMTLKDLDASVRATAEADMNCWDKQSFMSHQSQRDPNFAKEVMKYYGEPVTGKAGARKCQVLQEEFPDDVEIIAAHLYKSASMGLHLNRVGIAPADVNCNRNGLLLSVGIEKEFDILNVCFLYNKTSQKLHLYVADPELMQKPVHGSKHKNGIKFSDINGRELQCGDPKKKHRPFRRVLGLHAFYTFKKHKLFARETELNIPVDGTMTKTKLTWKYFRRSRSTKVEIPRFLTHGMEEDAVHEMMGASDDEEKRE